MKPTKLRKTTRALFARLCEEIPLHLPIRLVAHTDKEARGTHRILQDKKRGVRHIIRIEPGMPEMVEWETLVHEYAHAMTFSYPGKSLDAVWGVAYSDVYKVVFGDH